MFKAMEDGSQGIYITPGPSAQSSPRGELPWAGTEQCILKRHESFFGEYEPPNRTWCPLEPELVRR